MLSLVRVTCEALCSGSFDAVHKMLAMMVNGIWQSCAQTQLKWV